MGGDHKDQDLNNPGPDDIYYAGRCGHGCSCDQCHCRSNHHVDSGANGETCGCEDGVYQLEGVQSIPIGIKNNSDLFAALALADASFQKSVPESSAAPQPAGASFALTHANMCFHMHSHDHGSSYQEEWLRQERKRVDENPSAAFLSPFVERDIIETDEDGVFGPMDLESSMLVEESIAGETSRSTISRMTCSRSHSSSASQVLTLVGANANYMIRPLPLTDAQLPELQEVTCPDCGCEHL